MILDSQEQCWRNYHTIVQAIIQTISIHNTWCQKRKQTCRSIEEIEDPNKNTCNDRHLTFAKHARKYALKKGEHLQQMVLGRLDVHAQKKEIRTMSIIMHQNQLWMDLIPHYKKWNSKISEENKQYLTRHRSKKGLS